MLIDDEGNDLYTGFQYAVGFGGPLGVGPVLDVKGDDSYHVPDRTPGDPRFQYDAFGIGVDAGSRVLSKNPQYVAYNMAGGWGSSSIERAVIGIAAQTFHKASVISMVWEPSLI